MTDPIDDPDAPQDGAPAADATRRPGERLAKAIARAGLGSRRDAEIWIAEGRVTVNGGPVETPNVNVMPTDRVEVDGRPLPARERTRLWLYHKPRGYVTTNRDPEGRETVFSVLPAGLPRVMTVGRLDINTEGLLLLTNDGGLARVLELPETGWLRRYRVRAFGRVTQDALNALKDGVTIDGFAYGAIEAEIERQQNDNVWLMVGLREGKNREVKRLAEHLGLAVNRLIRVSFGPFQLGALPEGEAEEVRTKTLSEQIGPRLAEEGGCDFTSPVEKLDVAPRMTGGRGAGRGAEGPAGRPERSRLADPSKRIGNRAPVVRPRDMPAPASSSGQEERPATKKRAAPIADRRGRKVAVERVSRQEADAAPKRVHRRDDRAAERFGAAGRAERPGRPSTGARGKPFDRDDDRPRRAGPRHEGDDRAPRRDDARPPRGDRPEGARGPRRDDDRPAPRWRDAPREGAEALSPRPPRPEGDRPRAARPFKARSEDGAGRPRRDHTGEGAERRGPRPPRPDGDRPRAARPFSPRSEDGAARPRRDHAGEGAERRGPRPPRGDRPEGDRRPPRAEGDRPRFGRPAEGRGGDRPQPRWRDGAAEGGEARSPRPPRPERPEGGRPPRSRDGAPPRAPRGDGPRPGGGHRGKPGAGGPRPAGKGGRPGSGGGPRTGPKGPGRPGGGGKGRPGGADRRR